MKSIIVNFNQFALNQTILVYVDGACVEHAQAPVDNLVNVVNGLKNKYNIAEINLCGNSEYLSQFKAQFGLQFNTDNSVINIIER